MKKTLNIIMYTFMVMVLTSCGKTAKNESPATQYYNIIVVLDGTDVLAHEHCTPRVGASEIVDLASFLSSNGKGSLYATYVDGDCENNEVLLYESFSEMPHAPQKKPYVKISEYQKNVKIYQEDSCRYSNELKRSLSKFSAESDRLVSTAYSEKLAKQNNGSDIHGAINRAFRILRASASNDENKTILLLVSDMADNVGKKLDTLDIDAKILVVGTNSIEGPISGLITKQFVTFNQAVKYIFD